MEISKDCSLHTTTNTINSSIVIVSKEEMSADLDVIMLQQTDDAKEHVLLLEILWHTNIEYLHPPSEVVTLVCRSSIMSSNEHCGCILVMVQVVRCLTIGVGALICQNYFSEEHYLAMVPVVDLKGNSDFEVLSREATTKAYWSMCPPRQWHTKAL